MSDKETLSFDNTSIRMNSEEKGGGLLGDQNNKFVFQFQKPRGLIQKNTVLIKQHDIFGLKSGKISCILFEGGNEDLICILLSHAFLEKPSAQKWV